MSHSTKILEIASRTLAPETSNLIEECLSVWRDLGLTEKPRAEWFPRKVVPFSATLSELFESVEQGGVDAIVFVDERRNSPLHNLRDVIGTLQAPIVDLKGKAGTFADVHFDLIERGTWGPTGRCILDFKIRRRKLAPVYRTSNEPEMQLLAHMFVSGRQLMPKRYPAITDTVSYPGFPSAKWTVPLAESLAKRGLVTKAFFDRKHECDHCGSRRLTVREECPSCRSAHLQHTAFIHHYHCATLRPESEFRQGNALICPKCRQQLRNYGKDYDKPGNAQVCSDCDTVTSEPEVGFVCLDCDARTSSEAAKTVDLFSYTITDAAVDLLTAPRKPITAPAGIPLSLVTELEHAKLNTTERTTAVAEVRYGRAKGSSKQRARRHSRSCASCFSRI